MREFDININGKTVAARAEPRTHLADFLREQNYLTATHIGCEHGVCGACTVLIDGCLARSCITYAVACEGADVTTLEGLRSDPIMVDLREAFSTHHGLQCGYCTPGMLIAARDIISRVPNADESRVRLELSGNLCRCTGYVGIVDAIMAVLDKRQAAGFMEPVLHAGLGPVGARRPSTWTQADAKRAIESSSQTSEVAAPPTAEDEQQWNLLESHGIELTESFSVPYSRQRVWEFFSHLDQVARCMPGARLTKPPTAETAEGELNVKIGPILTKFTGVLQVVRDDAKLAGAVRGVGRDYKRGSSARAIVRYTILASEADTSRVDISVKFLLTGALAQFSRSGLVKDIADRLTILFAENVRARLSGAIAQTANAPEALKASTLLRGAIWKRVTEQFARLAGNSK